MQSKGCGHNTPHSPVKSQSQLNPLSQQGAMVKIFAWPSEIGQNEKGIRTGEQGHKKQVM